MESDPVEMEILKQLKMTSTSDTDEDLSYGKTIALNLKRLQPQ